MSIPDELARREERLKKIAEARTKIEARAKERFEREQAEYQAKLAAREAKTKTTGNRPGGKPPQPPVEGPLPTDQINLTDEESRIMPVSGGGFEQCYNAQAVVAQGSLLVVAGDVVQSPNDKQQLEPMLAKTMRPVQRAGQGRNAAGRQRLLQRGQCKGVQGGRDRAVARHGPGLASSILERALRLLAPAAPENPTPVEAMAHRLQTPEGKKLYALRKHTPEPVFGIIKSVLGFRQFLLRGLDKVKGEWNLVTMAWNLKRMFVLKAA